MKAEELKRLWIDMIKNCEHSLITSDTKKCVNCKKSMTKLFNLNLNDINVVESDDNGVTSYCSYLGFQIFEGRGKMSEKRISYCFSAFTKEESINGLIEKMISELQSLKV